VRRRFLSPASTPYQSSIKKPAYDLKYRRRQSSAVEGVAEGRELELHATDSFVANELTDIKKKV
jgi:hypothetical protein